MAQPNILAGRAALQQTKTMGYQKPETRWQKTWRLLKKYHFLWVPLVIIYLDRIFILWPHYSFFGEIPFFMKLALLETFGHTIWFTFHLGVLLLMLLGWLWVVLIHIAVAFYICRLLNRLFKEISYRRAMDHKVLTTIHREVAREQVHNYFRELRRKTKQNKFLVQYWPWCFLVQAIPKEECKKLASELPSDALDPDKVAATLQQFDQYLVAFYHALKHVKAVYVDRVWGESGPPALQTPDKPIVGAEGLPPLAQEQTTTGTGGGGPAVVLSVEPAAPVAEAPVDVSDAKPAGGEAGTEALAPSCQDGADQVGQPEMPPEVGEGAVPVLQPGQQGEREAPEPEVLAVAMGEVGPAGPEAALAQRDVEPAGQVQPAAPSPAGVALARMEEMAESGRVVKPLLAERISLAKALSGIEAKIESKDMLRQSLNKPPLTEAEKEQIRQEYLSKVDPEELAAWRASQAQPEGDKKSGVGQGGQGEPSGPGEPMSSLHEVTERQAGGAESGLVGEGQEDSEEPGLDDDEDYEDDEDEEVTPEQWAEALQWAGGDPLVAAVIRLMRNRDEWQGPPSEMLVTLGLYAPREAKEDDNWPKNVRWLTRKLNQSVHQMVQVGIKLENARTKQNRVILISRI